MGSLLATFSAALEARDPYLRGHSARVTAIAESLARRLGWRGERLDALRLGGSLHDVGKIAVDASVLRKPGAAAREEELAQIRTHPVAGARLIEGVEDFRPALPYVLLPPRALGRRRLSAPASPARRSRSKRGCSESRTPSTR